MKYKFECKLNLRTFADRKLATMVKDVELPFIPNEGIVLKFGEKYVTVSWVVYDVDRDSWKMHFRYEYCREYERGEWLAEGFVEETT